MVFVVTISCVKGTIFFNPGPGRLFLQTLRYFFSPRVQIQDGGVYAQLHEVHICQAPISFPVVKMSPAYVHLTNFPFPFDL